MLKYLLLKEYKVLNFFLYFFFSYKYILNFTNSEEIKDYIIVNFANSPKIISEFRECQIDNIFDYFQPKTINSLLIDVFKIICIEYTKDGYLIGYIVQTFRNLLEIVISNKNLIKILLNTEFKIDKKKELIKILSNINEGHYIQKNKDIIISHSRKFLKKLNEEKQIKNNTLFGEILENINKKQFKKSKEELFKENFANLKEQASYLKKSISKIIYDFGILKYHEISKSNEIRFIKIFENKNLPEENFNNDINLKNLINLLNCKNIYEIAFIITSETFKYSLIKLIKIFENSNSPEESEKIFSNLIKIKIVILESIYIKFDKMFNSKNKYIFLDQVLLLASENVIDLDFLLNETFGKVEQNVIFILFNMLEVFIQYNNIDFLYQKKSRQFIEKLIQFCIRIESSKENEEINFVYNILFENQEIKLNRNQILKYTNFFNSFKKTFDFLITLNDDELKIINKFYLQIDKILFNQISSNIIKEFNNISLYIIKNLNMKFLASIFSFEDYENILNIFELENESFDTSKILLILSLLVNKNKHLKEDENLKKNLLQQNDCLYIYNLILSYFQKKEYMRIDIILAYLEIQNDAFELIIDENLNKDLFLNINFDRLDIENLENLNLNLKEFSENQIKKNVINAVLVQKHQNFIPKIILNDFPNYENIREKDETTQSAFLTSESLIKKLDSYLKIKKQEELIIELNENQNNPLIINQDQDQKKELIIKLNKNQNSKFLFRVVTCVAFLTISSIRSFFIFKKN